MEGTVWMVGRTPDKHTSALNLAEDSHCIHGTINNILINVNTPVVTITTTYASMRQYMTTDLQLSHNTTNTCAHHFNGHFQVNLG